MIRNRVSRLQSSSPGALSVTHASPSPLPADERAFFERGLGQDFSRVRVHTDEGAAVQAEALGARAFTIGSDIAFAEGRYEPGTTEGRRLLAHELTHVAQQSRGGPATGNSESRAHAAADRVAEGSSVSAEAQGAASTGIQCDEDEEKKKEQTAAPVSAPATTPSAAPGGVSFGAAGLTYPGLSSGFQLTLPQWGTPQLPPPIFPYPRLSESMLPPGAEGPLPLQQVPPGLLTPPFSVPQERKIEWLPLQMSYMSRGASLTDRDAEAIMRTWDLNSELLSTLGITDRFKFLFITKDWILNKGLQKQVEDLNIRDNPNALDKANAEFKRAYPGGWETPMVPIFSTDWFLDESKK